MKKDFLLIAAAATMLTACVNLDTLNGVDDYEAPGAIGFSTITSNQTKAENSSATKKHSLGNYHQSFQVWGSKTVNSTTTTVFDGQLVSTSTTPTSAEGTYTEETAATHNAALPGALNTTNALTAAQANAYNATLDGAIASGTALTEAQAGLVNTALTLTGGDAYEENNNISEEHAIAYNNTLIGHKEENEHLDDTQAKAYNATLPGAVAASDIIEAVYDWTYSPLVFWDKSATSYAFNAAAPAGIGWAFAEDKITLENFSVNGATIAASDEIDPKAYFGPKDIMISEDIDAYTAFKTFTAATAEPVKLSFIHLLSRLNIGIKKATPLLDDYIVNLKSIKIYRMKSNGNFNEGQAISHNSLVAGTYDRWTDPTSAKTYYDGVGYETSTVVTTSLKYVYQALAIPQEIVYQSIALNGSDAAASEKPYLEIKYDIWNKAVAAVNYTEQEAIDYNAALEGAVSTTNINPDTEINYTTDEAKAHNAALPGAVSTTTVKTPAVTSRKLDDYSYTYNLADAFNGDGNTNNIEFNEGWMNTLKITINPIAIDFDAEVYEWAPVDAVEVDVPDVNTPS